VAVVVTAAVVVAATPVVVSAVLTATAGALDLTGQPGAVRPASDVHLDVAGADLQAGEAGNALEAGVAVLVEKPIAGRRPAITGGGA